MAGKRQGKKISVILCLIWICGLLQTGCGLTAVGRDSNPMPQDNGTEGRSSVGSAEDVTDIVTEGDIGGNAEAVTAAGVSAEGEPGESGFGDTQTEAHLTAEEILEQLISDEGFRERVRRTVGITEEDTEQSILQKLEQCEGLVLKSEAVYSLEDLSRLPKLQSLVIDFDTWEKAQIDDFTPILGLSRLQKLYIRYTVGEKMDFSFLAEMDTITELFLVDCDLKDVSFLEEMPQLECLSLYGTPVADLEVLENLTELVELTCG